VRFELLKVVRRLRSFEKSLAQDGCKSIASWLSMHLGVSFSSAKEIADVAEVAEELPALLNQFVSGSLSWDKLVLLCSFATPQTDEELASIGPSMTIRQLRELSRRHRELDEESVTDDHEARFLKFRFSRDGRFMRVNGLFPAESAAVIRKAVEITGDAIGPDENGNYLPSEKLNADALSEICSSALGSASSHDSAVIIEADISVLSGTGTADIERDGVISPATLRRILCSASVELAITGPEGRTIGSGRKTRLFPPGVLRAIMRRDQGCRFPGCERRRWVHGHHVNEWNRDKGTSDEDNGIILCDHHHTFVHEYGWVIEGSVYGQLLFIRPDGRVFTGAAPALRDDVASEFDVFADTG